MGKKGVIYIAQNKYHKRHLYKVGGSTRSGQARVDELNREKGTSAVNKFKLVREYPVDDVWEAESECRESLSDYRAKGDREFYKADLGDIIYEIKRAIKPYKIKTDSGAKKVMGFLSKFFEEE